MGYFAVQLLRTDMLEACGVRPGDSLLIALSGGADSTALLLSLSELFREGRTGALNAAHYHHGIRGESADADERFCAALCETYGVPFISEHGDAPAYARQHGLSLETAARTLRYAFLHRVMRQCGASCVVTAHHRDDQAETVLMHLLRGAGTNGLAGMRRRSGDIARPLLTVSRGEIEAFLTERGQAWRTDATNDRLDAARNRVRHELMPALIAFRPDAAEALCKTAALAGEDDAYLTKLACDAADAARCGDGFEKAALGKLEKPVVSRVIRQMLKRTDDDVTRADIERVAALLTAQTGTRIELSHGRAAWVDSRCIYVGTYPKAQAYETPFCAEGETILPCGRLTARHAEGWHRPENARELFLDADRLPKNAVVRTRRAGDRFYPLGAPGQRKLSDVLTDKHIPLTARDMPLIAVGSEVYAVCGLTVSEQVKITPQTRHILHIVYEGEAT